MEIAFVSYWEWAKLIATSLANLLVHHSRGFFALVVAHKVVQLAGAPSARTILRPANPDWGGS